MALRLIVGDDPVLVGESVTRAIDELVGDGDRSLMLEILTEAEYRTEDGSFEPTRLIDAARTPPLLTDKRVVVGRHASRWAGKEQLSAVTGLLGEPFESTDLVIVWERGVDPRVDRMPSLPKALKAAVGGCRWDGPPDCGPEGQGCRGLVARPPGGIGSQLRPWSGRGGGDAHRRGPGPGRRAVANARGGPGRRRNGDRRRCGDLRGRPPRFGGPVGP